MQLHEGQLSNDWYTLWCMCEDDSMVEYKIEGWIKMVYQKFPDGRKRKAQYEDGKWINF